MAERKCSFCGKENSALMGTLKNDVYICNDCVSVCSKIFFNEKTDPFSINLNNLLDDIGTNHEERKMIHIINYSITELKQMVLSKNDAEIIHNLKRHMNKIVYNKNLPGEVFRKYPQNINYAYVNFRPFLKSKEYENYNIEVSNYGRIRINGLIERQVEVKEGYFYIKSDAVDYPVYRFVAEVWCECPFSDSVGWQVHHISNDGSNNMSENLIWIEDSSHNKIPKYALDKFKNIFTGDGEDRIKEMSEDMASFITSISGALT
jgi:hypothetical protein